MDQITPCVITFRSTIFVNALIQVLTPDLIEAGIHGKWWNALCLKANFNPAPIDLEWEWGEDVGISYNDIDLESEKVGLVTGDGYIQGAMLISSEAVPSILKKQAGALFVEKLFTAPQNRSKLRADGLKYFGGIGLELLRWGALFSRELGYEGRLMLDASPDYMNWYADLGFQKLAVEPVAFQGVQYIPMELPVDLVGNLLDSKFGKSR